MISLAYTKYTYFGHVNAFKPSLSHWFLFIIWFTTYIIFNVATIACYSYCKKKKEKFLKKREKEKKK